MTAGTAAARAVRQYMNQTIGGSAVTHHPFIPDFCWTDGLNFVAQTCEAWWLLDAIASHQPRLRSERSRWHEAAIVFQCWALTPRYSRNGTLQFWTLECWSDVPDESDLMASAKIHISTFPEDLCVPYCDEHGPHLPGKPWCCGELSLHKEKQKSGFRVWVKSGECMLPAEY